MIEDLSLDARLRAWVREHAMRQQMDLGLALEEAGLVKRRPDRAPGKQGQVWVSRYGRRGSAKASIDHIAIIAEFFTFSLGEFLLEVLGPEHLGGEHKPRDERAAALMRWFSALDTNRQDAILSALDVPFSEESVREEGADPPAARRSGRPASAARR